MKLNKFNIIAPAAALLLSASLSSCMDDLNKGNIDPTVDANPNITGLYSKCYAGLIMEGNDGNADFSIDDAGKSTLLRKNADRTPPLTVRIFVIFIWCTNRANLM